MKDFLFNEIERIKRNCSEFDWDGYDAEPVPIEAIRMARELVKSFPDDFPVPEIGADPDGEVSFDWFNEDGGILTASINGEGRIAFAYVDNVDSIRGSIYFIEEFPKELFDLVTTVTNDF